MQFTGCTAGKIMTYLETNRMHGEIIPTLLVEIPRNPELKKFAPGAMEEYSDRDEVLAAIARAGSANRGTAADQCERLAWAVHDQPFVSARQS